MMLCVSCFCPYYESQWDPKSAKKDIKVVLNESILIYSKSSEDNTIAFYDDQMKLSQIKTLLNTHTDIKRQLQSNLIGSCMSPDQTL